MLILKSQKVNKGAKPPKIFGQKLVKEVSKVQALELLFAKLFKKNYVDIKGSVHLTQTPPQAIIIKHK